MDILKTFSGILYVWKMWQKTWLIRTLHDWVNLNRILTCPPQSESLLYEMLSWILKYYFCISWPNPSTLGLLVNGLLVKFQRFSPATMVVAPELVRVCCDAASFLNDKNIFFLMNLYVIEYVDSIAINSLPILIHNNKKSSDGGDWFWRRRRWWRLWNGWLLNMSEFVWRYG